MSETNRRKFLAAAGAGAAAGRRRHRCRACVRRGRSRTTRGQGDGRRLRRGPPRQHGHGCWSGSARSSYTIATWSPGSSTQREVSEMSSHREAPEISKDPVADGTDTYAFVSPDKPGTVTLIANFIPLQPPDGGPNFYEFGDDVAYDIKIANGGKGKADIVYRFQFTPRSATRRRSSTTPGRSPASTARTGTGRSSTRSPGSRAATASCSARTWLAHRSTSASGARRTTPALAARRCTRSATGRSSPVSEPTRSTSTSAASSISARCGRSTART